MSYSAVMVLCFSLNSVTTPPYVNIPHRLKLQITGKRNCLIILNSVDRVHNYIYKKTYQKEGKRLLYESQFYKEWILKLRQGWIKLKNDSKGFQTLANGFNVHVCIAVNLGCKYIHTPGDLDVSRNLIGLLSDLWLEVKKAEYCSSSFTFAH